MNSRLCQVVGAFLLVCGWSGVQAEEAPIGDPESERYSELEKNRSAFKETWVLPGVDFTQFDKLLVWDAQFEYRDVGPAQRTRSSILTTRKREFGISEGDRAAFEEVVGEAFMKEIERGRNFRLVEEAGPNTLILRGALLDIISKVPPETVGRTNVYLSQIGEATLVMELLNAETGDVLALVSERKKIEPPGGQVDQFTPRANTVTINFEIKRWAQSAAARLRGELDKALAGR